MLLADKQVGGTRDIGAVLSFIVTIISPTLPKDAYRGLFSPCSGQNIDDGHNSNGGRRVLLTDSVGTWEWGRGLLPAAVPSRPARGAVILLPME